MCENCENSADSAEVKEAIERLRAAIQGYASARGRNCVVTEALVIYEELMFDGDGEPERAVNWCIPTDNFSLSGAIGLADLGAEFIRRDLIPVRVEHNE